MAISIAQYVDLLFKKLQGVAKTANATVKGASNESIASPPLLRADVIWTDSGNIPNVASQITGLTLALRGANAVQCGPDTTVPPIGGIYPTWLANTTYWIPQEFGSTWLPKVYVGPSGAANIEATGTQIFAVGSGGTGEYYFDTQAGVLNFIGETIPAVLTSGNVVYIAGYQYVGEFGLGSGGGGNAAALTVSLIDSGNAITNAVSNVEFLRFDANSGFGVEDLGNGNVKISLGSTFKTWVVGNSDPGQPNLVASGEDIVQFVQGNGIAFTSNNTPTGNAYKSLTIDVNLSNYTGNITTSANLSAGNIETSGVITVGDAIYGPSGNGYVNLSNNDDVLIGTNGNTGIVKLQNANGAHVTLGSDGNVDITGNTAINANITANYYFGNGAFLTGITVASDYSNANVANYLPTYTGNLSPGNLVIFGGVANLGPAANVKIAGGTLNYYLTSDGSGGLAWAAGSGNITGNGTVAGADQQIQFNDGTANFAASAALKFDYTANILRVTGNIDSTSNISANYFIGNGAFLTGIAGGNLGNITISGANISTDITNGNIGLSGNGTGHVLVSNVLPWNPATGPVNDAVDLGSATYQFRDLYVGNVITPAGNTGNATQIQPSVGAGQSGVAFVDAISGSAADVSAGVMYVDGISATGNVIVDTYVEADFYYGNGFYLTGINAANIDGLYSNANAANYLAVYNGNALFGNLSVSQNASVSGNTTTSNLLVTNNAVVLGNFRVEGTTTYINVTNLDVQDKVIIVAANANAVPSDLNAAGFQIGNMSGGGNVTFLYNSTGNVMQLSHGINIANVLNVSGPITSTGNVTAPYFIGNGALLTGVVTSSYSNANVAAYLASNSNVLILTTSNITTSANAQANNFVGTSTNTTIFTDEYAWTFDNVGNLTAPGNGNIIGGNVISANYFIGNGAFLTGISAGTSYSNANVANYLPTYTGALTSLTGNVTTTANISGNYFIGNGSLLTGISSANLGNITISAANISTNILNGNVGLSGNGSGVVYISNVLPWNISTGPVNDAVDLGSPTYQFRDLYVGNVITPAGNQGNATQIQPASGAGQSGVAFVDAITGSAADVSAGVMFVESIDASGSITADTYVEGAELISLGNLTVGDNANIANGIKVGGYANFLGNLKAENIAAVTNIEAQFYYGNGFYLYGINAANLVGSYSNANVANYMPVYNGNILAGNITVSNSVVIQGNLQVLGNTTTIEANSLVISDKDIVVANGATNASQANGAGIVVGASNIANIIYLSTPNYWSLYPGVYTAGNVIADTNLVVGANASANNVSVGNVLTANTGNFTCCLQIGGASTTYFQGYTTSNTADQVLYEANAATSAQLDFNIIATDPTLMGGSRQSSKLLSTTYGNSTDFVEYGGVYINTPVGDFTVDQLNGNVRLLVSPQTNANISYSVLVTRLV